MPFQRERDAAGAVVVCSPGRGRYAKNAEHYGAMDELYVHHLLQDVTPEIRYEEGGRGPDFRLYTDGRPVLAVEVLSLFMRDDWTQATRAFGRLGDYLNRQLRLQGSFLDVDILEQQADLPLRAIAADARKFLAALPDPQVAAAGTGAVPAADFQRPGVHVRLRALPMRPGARSSTNPDARIVGAGPVIGGMVNSHLRLKRALSDKRAERYELVPGIPYLIVVGNHDLVCDENQLMRAVYGYDWEQPAQPAQPGPPLVADEALRGFFDSSRMLGTSGAPRNTRVSAVAVINEPRPCLLNGIQHLVMDNPHASAPLAAELFPATHRFRAWEGTNWAWRPRHPERSGGLAAEEIPPESTSL
jgi:hypothetical protein